MDEPTRSALIVTVPSATAAVGRHRDRFDVAGSWGVPAHVTVLYPFVPPASITDDVVARAEEAVATVGAFTFELRRTGWFGDTVLYLAPEPADRLVALTEVVARAFPEHPPYEGAHTEVVPHLTVGHDAPPAALRAVEADVVAHLPLAAEVTEVAWWCGRDAPGSWRPFAALPLGR